MNADTGTLVVRPLEADDLADLEPIDAAHRARYGLGGPLDAAALRHAERSGHAFVARAGERALGFVLAHAVWDGVRPVVRVARLAATGDDPAALARLLEAVVKSAYDAAVYDLVAEVPDADTAALTALEAASFASRPVRRYERVLGSRSVSP